MAVVNMHASCGRVSSSAIAIATLTHHAYMYCVSHAGFGGHWVVTQCCGPAPLKLLHAARASKRYRGEVKGD